MFKLCLKTLFFILISVTVVSAQLKVDFNGGEIEAGEIIEVDVSLSDFQDLVSFQFSLNWDPSVLTFNSVLNPTDLLDQFTLENNIGQPPTSSAVNEGQLTVSWSLTSTQVRSIPDNTRLFTLRLNGVGSACDKTALVISDLPRPIEAIEDVGAGLNSIGVMAEDREVSIAGNNCEGDPPPTACETGACDDSGDLTTVIVGSASGDAGTTVCLPVTGRNFADVASFASGIAFDPAVLRFTEVKDGALTGAILNTNNVDAGDVRYIWSDPTGSNPVTVDDGATLFEVCFELVGSEGGSGCVTLQSAGNTTKEIVVGNSGVEHCSAPGQLSINGDPPPPPPPTGCPTGNCDDSDLLSVSIGSVSGVIGNTVCVPVTAKNFANVASMATGLAFDANILKFVEVKDGALTGAILNTNNIEVGDLRYIWSDATGSNPVTVDDGTILFEMCFELVGSVGDVDCLTFLDAGNTTKEIVIGNSGVEHCVASGEVTIEDGDPPPPPPGDCPTDDCDTSSDISMIIGSIEGAVGATVCVPVTARNFNAVASVASGVAFDPAILRFVEVKDGALSGAILNQANLANGDLRYIWSDATGVNPVTAADGAVLFEICFELIGTRGESDCISFVSAGNTTREIVVGSSSADHCVASGEVTIGDGDPPPPPPPSGDCPTDNCDSSSDISLLIGSATGKTNGTVCLPVTARNFNDVASIASGIKFDPAVLEFAEVKDGALAGAILNVSSAASGDVRYIWSDPTGVNPVTVDDGTVLFEICFNIIGADGDTDCIEFVSAGNTTREVVVGSSGVDHCVAAGAFEIDNGDDPPPPPPTNDCMSDVCDDSSAISLLIGSAEGEAGTTVCVPVTSRNFNDVASIATGIEFDPAILRFVEIKDGVLGGAILNLANVESGDVRYIWADPTGVNPVTAADGTVLFEMCFELIGPKGSTDCLEFVSAGNTTREIVVGSSAADHCVASGGITIQDDDPPPPTGCPTNVCDDSDAISLLIGSVEGEAGATVCVPVTSRNFNDVASIATGIDFDPSILRFVEIRDGALSGAILNLANVDAGDVRYIWSDATGVNPVTAADGTVLFEMCFELIGAEESTDCLAFVDAGNTTREIVVGSSATEHCVSSGEISISKGDPPMPTDCPTDRCDDSDAISLLIGSAEGEQGTTVCVPVTSRNFNEVASIASGIEFDPSILRFVEIKDGALSGAILNLANVDAGDVRYIWADNTGFNPVTVADGTVLFEMCFELIGPKGSTNCLEFVSAGNTTREIVVGSSAADHCVASGGITIEDDGTVDNIVGDCSTTTNASMILSNTSIESGMSFCMDVTSRNFLDISSVSSGFSWDANSLQFEEIRDGALTGATVVNAGGGNATYSWMDASGNSAVTVADGTVLYQLCFSAIGSGNTSADVDFVDLGDTSIEIVNSSDEILPYCVTPATVSITEPPNDNIIGDCSSTTNASMVLSATSAESGTTFCMDVTSRNFENISGVSTGFTWDDTDLQFVEVRDGALTSAVTNSASSSSLNFRWTGDTANPLTVADETVLYQLCFMAIGSGDTDVEFADVGNTTIDIIDSANESIPYCVTPATVNITPSTNENIVGDCSSTTNASMILSDTSVDTGTSFCMDVTSRNFNNISAASTGLTWDGNSLRFDEIRDGALSGANVNSTNTGSINYLWSDVTGTSPVTVADGTVLFQICFTATGSGGTSTDINFADIGNTTIDIVNAADQSVPYCVTPATVSITGEVTENIIGDCSSTSNVSLVMNPASVEMGQRICVDVTSRNFEDVNNVTTGLTWDAGQLQFVEIIEGALTGASISGVSAGSATYQWSGNRRVDDGTVLFQVCFDAIGTPAQATIEFGEVSGVPIGIQKNGSETSYCVTPGVVTITADTTPEPISVNIEDVSADQGTEVCVSVFVRSFIDIQSAQYSMGWDQSVLRYSRLDNIGIPNFGSANINEDNGILTISWSPLSPTTLPDDSVLYDICFEVIGDCNTQPTGTVDFLTDRTLEITNSNNIILDFNRNAGNITVEPCEIQELSFDIEGDGGQTNPSCNGDATGSVVGTVRGGVPPYSCEWMNSSGDVVFSSNSTCSLTDVQADVYTVRITDSSDRVFEQTFTLTQPSAITVAESVTDAGCEPGRILITPSGGTGSFTYFWSDPAIGNTGTATGLSSGEYRVTISDGNTCQSIRSYTVGDNTDLLQLDNESVTVRSCDSDFSSIALEVSGGCGDIDFNWEGPNGDIRATEDVTNIAEGNWRVTISDDGASADIIREFNIVESFEDIAVVIDNVRDIGCQGGDNGEIAVSVTGGCTPYEFNWVGPDGSSSDEDRTGLPPGDYTLTVSDQRGNSFAINTTVNQTQPFTISANVSNATNLDGNNGMIDVTVSSGSGSYTYRWNDGSDSANRTGLIPGSYAVEITDTITGCTLTQEFEVKWSALFLDNISVTQVVSCPGAEDAIIDGQVVGGCGNPVITIGGTEVSLPLLNLAAGTYVLMVVDDCNNTDTKEIVVSEPDAIDIDFDVECSDPGSTNGVINLDVRGGTGDLIIDWSAGTIDASGLNASDLEAGSYTVVVEDANGCVASAQDIEVESCIPPGGGACSPNNVITPNGDGINDLFVFDCLNGMALQPNSLMVVDRWGRSVFAQDNYDNTWSGLSSDSEELNEGGYMWVLEIQLPDGSVRIDKGWLTLLRSN